MSKNNNTANNIFNCTKATKDEFKEKIIELKLRGFDAMANLLMDIMEVRYGSEV